MQHRSQARPHRKDCKSYELPVLVTGLKLLRYFELAPSLTADAVAGNSVIYPLLPGVVRIFLNDAQVAGFKRSSRVAFILAEAEEGTTVGGPAVSAGLYQRGRLLLQWRQEVRRF